MSTAFVQAALAANEELPTEMSLSITALREMDLEARALVAVLKEPLCGFDQSLSKEERLGRLAKYKETAAQLLKISERKQGVSTALAQTVGDQAAKLEQRHADFVSGEYVAREEAETQRRLEEFEAMNQAYGPESGKKRSGEEPAALALGRPLLIVALRSARSDSGDGRLGGGYGDGAKAKAGKKANKGGASKGVKTKGQPKYCVVNCKLANASEDDMVGCENELCPAGEWFHFQCVGLKAAPPKNKPWFCPACRVKKR